MHEFDRGGTHRLWIVGILLVLALLLGNIAARAAEEGMPITLSDEERALRQHGLERLVEVKIATSVWVNGVRQAYTIGGVIIRENLVITGTPARFPTATFALLVDTPVPAKLIGWATPEAFTAILYGKAGSGIDKPNIRFPVLDEKLLGVGMVEGAPRYFHTTVLGFSRTKARGHHWVLLDGVFPGQGTAFGVYAVSDGALVGLYVGEQNIAGQKQNKGSRSYMFSLEMIPQRLEQLKPTIFKHDWSGGQLIALK